jgi:prepilin-type N-terminal cleavage/methylation domain-containing protein
MRSPPGIVRSGTQSDERTEKETVMHGLLMELRKRRRNQKGFTLIEMLVVISILGILAAIVTMSMVGITTIAQQHANDTEKNTVQVALDAMAAQQQISPTCPGTATDDMANFPVASGGSTTPGNAVPLYPKYIHKTPTHQKYTCNADGVVSTG